MNKNELTAEAEALLTYLRQDARFFDNMRNTATTRKQEQDAKDGLTAVWEEARKLGLETLIFN